MFVRRQQRRADPGQCDSDAVTEPDVRLHTDREAVGHADTRGYGDGYSDGHADCYSHSDCGSGVLGD